MLRYVISLLLVATPVVASAAFSIDPSNPEPAGTQAEAPTEIVLSAPVGATPPSLAPTPGVVVGGATLDSAVVVRSEAAPAESWVISPADATVRRVLAKWAAKAGWQLSWEAPEDMPVTVIAAFEGDFRSAVKSLFSSLSAADVNLTALMYTGNRVLRVTEAGRRAQ